MTEMLDYQEVKDDEPNATGEFLVFPLYMRYAEEAKEILLLTRKGRLSLPGGHSHRGEELLDTGVREFREELGAEINREQMKLAHVVHCNGDNPAIGVIFQIDSHIGELVNNEPEEHINIGWYPLRNLDTLPLSGYARAAVEGVTGQPSVSEYYPQVTVFEGYRS